MARPVWWKVTLLFDAVFFGPFYTFAIYAFVRGKEWIRLGRTPHPFTRVVVAPPE